MKVQGTETNIPIGAVGAPAVQQRTNLRGTCLYCGRRLKRYRWRDAEWNKGSGREVGGYGDNIFCSLRCGYVFGAWAAKLGFRLDARDHRKKKI